MNNTFDLHRFTLLLKRQWLEFGKIFLITLLVAIGVILAFYGLTLIPIKQLSYVPYRLGFREPLFFIFGFLFISIIASTYFSHLGQKSKAIIDLLIPASTLEKFLAGVFFTSILSTLSYVTIFFVSDWAFISYVKQYFHSGDLRYLDQIQTFFVKNRQNLFSPLYLSPFIATSAFMLGSIYFNRFHYIKTAISVMVFSGMLWYIIFNAGKIIFSGKVAVNRGFNTGKEHMEWILFAILLTITLVIWVIGYVRLKEKEV